MKRNALLPPLQNRVAMKLGFLLLAVFLLIILSLGGILYSFFLSFYLSHIKEEVVHQTQSHANVLSDHFEAMTINHVIRMEQHPDQMVVVLDQRNKVLASSSPLTPVHTPYLTKIEAQKHGWRTDIEKEWDTRPFLVFDHPVRQNGEEVGTVVMFRSTAPMRDAVGILRSMLLITGAVTIFVVAGISFIISRMIVRPLVEMKRATREIARGNYTIKLSVRGGDEVSQLKASINNMVEQIRFYQDQRNEFLANIGHELRTPLTYLKGYSDILMQAEKSGADQEYAARIIHEQSGRMQRLVNDLFDLARMEQGRLSFHMERLSLEEIVTEALSLVEVRMDEKGIYLEYQPSDTPLYVWGDRQRMGQVLLNILENARRYTSVNSTIFIRVRQEDKYGVVEIKDTGPGIPKEDVPYVMERLYRVEKSRSESTGGAGLGLSISKEIVDKHGGKLTVHSVQGEGATFYVMLPLEK